MEFSVSKVVFSCSVAMLLMVDTMTVVSLFPDILIASAVSATRHMLFD